MKQIIQPLSNGWKLNEDLGFIQAQIHERVNSEDNFTHCRGYPLIKSNEVEGKLGKPLE